MIKYFCDICEKEAKHDDLRTYVLPCIKPYTQTFASRGMGYTICPTCEKQLWDFIQFKKTLTNYKTEFYGEEDDK